MSSAPLLTDINASFYGVAVGRFDPTPEALTAPIVAEILLDCAIRGEIERLERLAAHGAINDAWNERLRRRNWESYVRACRLLRIVPSSFDDDWPKNADLFEPEK